MEQVRHNAAGRRYELATEGGTAVAEYERRGDVVAITHTGVPRALEGRGIGSRLVKETLADIRAQGLKVLPLCSFVAAYIENHPEERDLLAR
jgi:predicted GNAT family acetyltransferase